ncbi:hypothetical protein Y032_0218g2421 [Ancylostoma ceylanicum]|uniref:ABC transporter domain-containing protein n=1 Tax=Ancylostoma ceylanicum TaxID=53326 RepID=A0A016SIZ2_9BILA|nr:hypothetical protein Y032_0218g2421 [Ancylostoma ceylanicum]
MCLANAASCQPLVFHSLIVNEHVEDAKTGELNGCQLRFELPRSQQERFPGLFAHLEDKKQSLRIESFGLSVNALEEAYLKVMRMGEVPSREADEDVFQDNSVLELQEGFFARIIQQLQYIWLKRIIEISHNISLIVNQILLPIALAILVGWTMRKKSVNIAKHHLEHHNVPDISLNRIKSGRVVVLDPSHNTEKRRLLEKVMKKYPHIQITHHRSSKWAEHWPKEFPWAVLGVIIRSQGAIANGSEAYYWLLPSYLYYKEQTLFHLISDVEYAAGKLQMHVSFTRMIADTASMTLMVLSPFLVFIAAVLMNSSFIPSLIEERVFHFKHQQFLAGLSPLLFWVATIIWDSGVIVVVAGIITLVMKIFKLAVTRMFMPLICAYCVAMLPMVYVLSLLIDTPGVAKSVSILYQIGSAALGFVMLFQGGKKKFTHAFPSFAVVMSFMKELFSTNIPKLSVTERETYESLLLHGVIFVVVLIVHELHFEKLLLKTVCKKTYIERSEVPDGADIIEERERVENNISDFALAVQDLTKYHGVTCAVKKTTYGIKEKDCFGLVGASGAGKTSTFDVITGLRSANSGTVFIGDEFVNRTQGIGYCPQFDAMLPRLSCRQNMMVIAALNGYKYPKKVVDEMLRFLDLTEHSSKAFSRCSGGQRRRVGIGVALMNPSKLAILDEPTAGIDPKTRHQIWSLLKKMRASGKAIVLSSHSMEECEALCSRIGILVRGRLVAIGASQTLKTRHADNFFLHMSMTSVTHKDLVVSTVLTTFPSGNLMTRREDALTLKFKIRQRKEDKVSTLYEKAQKMASSLPLKEFMLIQASLEDVLEILNEQYSGKAL